jgi:hypothetical protein
LHQLEDSESKEATTSTGEFSDHHTLRTSKNICIVVDYMYNILVIPSLSMSDLPSILIPDMAEPPASTVAWERGQAVVPEEVGTFRAELECSQSFPEQVRRISVVEHTLSPGAVAVPKAV